MKNILLIAILTTLISCSTINKEPICSNQEIKDCFICEVAEKYSTTPESIAAFIEGVNILAIYKNKYSAENALNKLNKLKIALNTDIKYLIIKKTVSELIKDHPEIFILSKNYMQYLNEFDSIEIMDSTSKKILIDWIDKVSSDMELLKDLK